ncbi:Immunoglobulin lambda constant 6 [Larimichthys crocea]|nr:Immunoglobulin lambda constant 6 [Larimichthys crocea]
MLGTLCTLITALTCVSGVTVVTQKPPVVALRKGETATMDCNLGTVTDTAAYCVFISFSLSSPHTPTLLTSQLNNVDAVKVLTQTPAVHTVSTGQEVVLKCNIQRDDDAVVSWYKQIPGEAPQYVLRFYHDHSSPSFGSGFSSDRFNSKASSNIDYQFIIKRAEAGDSAVYYCQTWDDSAKDAELQSNKATLVCLSSQSVPFADVSWLTGGSPVSSGISTSTAVQQPDQTFQISSYLDIQTSDWNMDKVYTCKVSLGSQTSEKNINKSGCPTEE